MYNNETGIWQWRANDRVRIDGLPVLTGCSWKAVRNRHCSPPSDFYSRRNNRIARIPIPGSTPSCAC